MKVREIIKLIQNDGWYQIRSKGGSYRQFRHATKSGKVTVSGKPNEDIHPKTLGTLMEQAGLK